MSFLSRYRRGATGHVGIAFEDGDVRMLQVREDNGTLSVTGAAVVKDQMNQSQPEVCGDALRAALVTGGFIGRNCVISIPRSEVWTQAARLPVMPDAEFAEAVAWECADRFGVERSQLQCDWRYAGQENGDRQEVLMIAVSRQSLDWRLDAALSAGLRPVAVDTGFAGVARLFSRHYRRDADTSRTRAVLDIGPGAAMLMELRGDSVAFCMPIPIGGRPLDAQVAQRLDMDQSEACELRQARLGRTTTLDPSTDGAVAEAVRPILADLSYLAMRCLRHYSVSVRGERPEYMLLSGTEAGEPGLADMLSATCRVKMMEDDVSGCLASLQAGLTQALPVYPGPVTGWAPVAGLSLRGLNIRTRRKAA